MPAITSTTSSPTPFAAVTLTDLDHSRLNTVVHRGHTTARFTVFTATPKRRAAARMG